jgi:hypothetical protein
MLSFRNIQEADMKLELLKGHDDELTKILNEKFDDVQVALLTTATPEDVETSRISAIYTNLMPVPSMHYTRGFYIMDFIYELSMWNLHVDFTCGLCMWTLQVDFTGGLYNCIMKEDTWGPYIWYLYVDFACGLYM